MNKLTLITWIPLWILPYAVDRLLLGSHLVCKKNIQLACSIGISTRVFLCYRLIKCFTNHLDFWGWEQVLGCRVNLNTWALYTICYLMTWLSNRNYFLYKSKAETNKTGFRTQMIYKGRYINMIGWIFVICYFSCYFRRIMVHLHI